MSESGVDLDFDLLSPDDFSQDEGEAFYELKSRILDSSSEDSSTLGLLLADRGNSLKNMSTPITRTNFKQQLQRQQLEQQDNLFQAQTQIQLDQSPSIPVPRTASPATVPPDVPSSVLQVKTQLENPTRYYVVQQQKRQLKQYLRDQGSPSTSELTAAISSASQPTLNAINQQAVAALSAGHMSGSPMAVMSPKANHNEEVDNLLDDIISLESNTIDEGLPWDPTLTLGSVPQVNTTGSVFDNLYSHGLGMTPLMQAMNSSSCPAMIKQESPELLLDQHFQKDRQKKDNHNMIERRRRFNINDRIKELGTLLPKQESSDSRQNKGTILKASVDYIKRLRRDQERMRQVEEEKRNTEELNRRLLLRVQELEMHARAHGIPTTPLTSDRTTALLSSILTAKPNPEIRIKQEPLDSGCAATPCSHESQEPMDDYSLPSSRNTSPHSAIMDDDMTD